MSKEALVQFCAKGLLRLVTCAIPVFIAACYGPQHATGAATPRCSGKVADKTTRAAISHIEVKCIVGDSAFDAGWTDPSGGYMVGAPQNGCSKLSFVDSDGTANGSYKPATIPVSGSGCNVDIELDKI